MEIVEVIFKGLFCICITLVIVFYLAFVAVTISDTNIKVTEIHHHLGLDSIPSDTINLNITIQ